MNISGIIAEYNPFHNGHLYHIQQARELTGPDLLIACLSGNYCQRGDLSIVNKYVKTKAALDHGVDLVVELPYIFTVQNAYVFGQKSVEILKRLNINNLIFGSETNNLEELRRYSELEIDITRLKQLMHEGHSYPKSYGLLSASLYPNDMLAVAYLKALKGSDIKPVSIQRTSDYNSPQLDIICSATAIRKAIKQGRDVSSATPLFIDKPVFNDDLYPYIRKLLMTSAREDLKKIFLVDEGIEKILQDNAVKYDQYEEFIDHSISRRYTRSRIQRILLHIANQVRKQDVADLPEMDYVRVLGFNQKGQQYLKQIRDEVNIITQFRRLPEPYKNLEWKSNLLYYSLSDNSSDLIRRELMGPIIVE